ncbi:aldo/keto reductase [Streptomyces sp. NPDC096354]|uniref:aldo/keto reductase n=1 Tax=Streptomyces sp. NPDC096354 TaxID=3366088 RepID=UPI00381783F0
MTDCTDPETGTPRQSPPGWARRLPGYCLRHRTDLLLAFGAVVVAAVATATLPLVLRHVVDGVAAGTTASLVPWTVLLAAIGAVRFGASFGGGRQVLHGVCLRIAPGETVALVGATGAGKSTVVKLLARFYDPSAGTVRVDGHDLRELDLSGFRRRLGVVPQEARLAEDAGLTLVQLALAFVLEHPAVTSAIIGPRTFERLAGQLGADRVRLGGGILDQIDKIVPPGTNLSARDAGYQPVALTDPALRRRSARPA